MIKSKRRTTSKNQEGATLIEALVSILILSLGLLGMAGLQLNALSFEKSSWSTHRIAELTGDISERIRSNPTAATNGNYVYTAAYSTAKAATISSNNCRQSGTDCTTSQIANDDLSAWLDKAKKALPGGAVRLEGDPTNGFVVTALYADKDFINPVDGTPSRSTTCNGTQTGTAWRNCCPSAAAVPDGVRCFRTNIIP